MQEPERRQNLWERVQQLGDLLGVAVQSPVIPLVVGDEATALAASAQLLKKGFHVPAIRPPTVPKNTSRWTLKTRMQHHGCCAYRQFCACCATWADTSRRSFICWTWTMRQASAQLAPSLLLCSCRPYQYSDVARAGLVLDPIPI